MPRVSVIIPVYNGASTLREAIDSVLAQTYGDYEVIVINDGSTDESGDVALSYKDHKVRVVTIPENKGLSNARNVGIAASSGEFIALLDCDDTALADRLKVQVEYLDENSHVGLVAAWVELMDHKGVATGEIGNPSLPSHIIPAWLLFRNPFYTPTITFRRECVPAGGFRDQLAEDYDFIVRLTMSTTVANMPRVLARYRQNPLGLMATKFEKVREGFWGSALQQLQRLGICREEADRDAHLHITYMKEEGTFERLDRCSRWMLTVKEANDRKNIYDNQALNRVLGLLWVELCGGASRRGFPMVTYYYRSGLKKVTTADLCSVAKLWGKSFLR